MTQNTIIRIGGVYVDTNHIELWSYTDSRLCLVMSSGKHLAYAMGPELGAYWCKRIAEEKGIVTDLTVGGVEPPAAELITEQKEK